MEIKYTDPPSHDVYSHSLFQIMRTKMPAEMRPSMLYMESQPWKETINMTQEFWNMEKEDEKFARRTPHPIRITDAQLAVQSRMTKLGRKLDDVLKEWTDVDPSRKGVYKTRICKPSTSRNLKKLKWIGNPLIYAADYHTEFTKLIPNQTDILFVATNPPPKSPTGIPLYENDAVGKLLRVDPLDEKYLNWTGSDVDMSSDSGQLFWAVMIKIFGSIEEFFRHCYVINCCPLIFMDEKKRNISAKNLWSTYEPAIAKVKEECHYALRDVIEILKPKLIVELGAYARDTVASVVPGYPNVWIYHPATAYHNMKGASFDDKCKWWESNVDKRLIGNGIWDEVTMGQSPYYA